MAMAIDLLAGMDETDDGEWATCWDFDRNDWGKKEWGGASTWTTEGKGQHVPWWFQASPTQSSGWKPAGQGQAQDSPFAGDATLQAMTSPWWQKGAATEAPWGAQAARPPADAPYWGDSDGTAAVNMAALVQQMQGYPLIPPPPPPPGESYEGELGDKQHPWSKKEKSSKKEGKERKERKDKDDEDGKEEKPKKRKSVDGTGSRETKDEIAVVVEEALAMPNAIVQKADFDSGVRRYLGALRGCQGGQQKVKDALAMIHTYTISKQRSSVKNWPAYLLTLLKRFEPDVFAKIQAAKGEGKGADAGRPKMSAGEAAAKALPRKEPPPPGLEEKVPKPPTEPTAPAITLPEVLPESWFEGRQPLLAEVTNFLGKPKCPFTGKALDLQDNLVAEMAICLAASSGKAALCRHAMGATGCRDLVDCPRAVKAGAAGDAPEFRALAEDSSSMDGVKAIATAAKKRPLGAAAAVAQTVRTEIGLEVLAELLRNPNLKK